MKILGHGLLEARADQWFEPKRADGARDSLDLNSDSPVFNPYSLVFYIMFLLFSYVLYFWIGRTNDWNVSGVETRCRGERDYDEEANNSRVCRQSPAML